MILRFLVLSLVLISSGAVFAVKIEWRECQNDQCDKSIRYGDFSQEKAASYKSIAFPKPSCVALKNCWLYLGEVADSLEVFINGKELIKYSNDQGQPVYLHHTSVMLPIPSDFFQDVNIISLKVLNLNQGIIGFDYENSFISNYKEVNAKSNLDWGGRTGGTLMSGYALLMFAVAFFVMLLVKYNPILTNLFIYSLVAAIYLLSFSEVLREYLDPLILSGPIHFTLRLLQDYLLARLFLNILEYRGKVRRIVNWGYGMAIGTVLSMYFWGLTNYHFFLNLMLVLAPLVALPMIIGFLLGLRLENWRERRVFLPIAFLLMVMQVNDLFVFWRLYSGYYFVKWYPPLIIILLLLLYIRREILVIADLKANEELFKVSAQVTHDLRSPIEVLEMLAEDESFCDPSSRKLFNMAVGRLNSIVQDVLNLRKFSTLKKLEFIDPLEAIEEIFEEKRFSIRRTFDFKNLLDEKVSISINKADFQRCFSNILNNAIEASRDNDLIQIKLYTVDRRCCCVDVIDQGVGMSPDILEKLGKMEITSGKLSGNGIGMLYTFNTIKKFGGDVRIQSEPGKGTKVTIILETKLLSTK